jgi:hypothetical protein
MTDHRTLRQRIEEHFGPPCDGKSEGICDQCQLRADILEALRDAPPATLLNEAMRHKGLPIDQVSWAAQLAADSVASGEIETHPAAEPPAPPALSPMDWYRARMAEANDTSVHAIQQRDEARAEVARLQEELKQAQSATFTSERFRAEDAWSRNGDLIVTVKDRDRWKQEAGYNAALADSFQQQVIKLEAEAQALRERNSTLEREIADITDMTRSTVIVKRPAQEAPK